MRYNPIHLPKLRSRQVLAAACGCPCTIRIASFVPGLKCAGNETVVACHLPVGGKGMSSKVSDISVAYGCAVCHDLLDGRHEGWGYLMEHYQAAVLQRLLCAHSETLAIMLDYGVIHVPDGDLVRSGPWRSL